MENDNRIKGRGWILLICPWVAIAICFLFSNGVGMMIPMIRQDLGLDLKTISYLSTVTFGTQVILTIPVSIAANKVSPKYLIGFMLIGVAAGSFLHGLAWTMPVIIIARILLAIGGSGLNGPLALIKDSWVPMKKITVVNGYEQFFCNSGQVIGTLLITALVGALGGWRNMMYVLGGVASAAAIVWFASYRENTEHPVELSAEKESFLIPLKDALKEKSIWLLTLGWPGTTFVWIAFMTFWPTYATENLGLSLTQAGIVTGMIPLFSAISCLLAPQIANLIGKDKLMLWPWGIVLCVVYFAGINVSNFPLLCVIFAIAGFGAYAFVPIGFSLPFKLGTLSPAAINAGIAFMITFMNLGGTLASILVNSLMASMDLKSALTICCAAPLLWTAFSLFLPERGREYQERIEKAQ